MSAKPFIDCPKCCRSKLIKLISPGASIIIPGTKNPCRGNRGNKPKKKLGDRLGEGKNQGKQPFWRDGSINKEILKNPKRYIKEGKVD